MNEYAKQAWDKLWGKFSTTDVAYLQGVFTLIWNARGEADKGVVTNVIVPRGHLAKDNAVIKAIAALDEPFKE